MCGVVKAGLFFLYGKGANQGKLGEGCSLAEADSRATR